MLESGASGMSAMAPAFRVVGVRVDAVQLPEAVARIKRWIDNRENGKYVAVTGMHGVAESRQDPRFREILNQAALVVPDGMPLVWLGRWHGHSLRRRVTGSELMLAFCRETGPGPRHFFYGGAPGVAEDLARQLHARFDITVAGTYTPPFRPLTVAEEVELTAQVQAAAPDVLWVGLSTPKQERWMYAHRLNLKVPVILGVGAAFDMNSGRLKRAPAWMRDSGLEWFYRLVSEPRRLWKRYLVVIPKSMWSISLELFHIRKFE
jgi:N-acetylglucosaminyldiphosphoundecaprenol N-acetyl-beta-D-mannosaminyltransferase